MGSTKPDKTQLTPREIEIQQLRDSGMSRKDIAAQLGIAYDTVNHHIHSIRERAMGAKEKQVEDDEPFYATGFVLPPDITSAIVNKDAKEKQA